MNATGDNRTRTFIIVGVLAVAALAVGLFLFSRRQSSSEAAPPPGPTTSVPAVASPSPATPSPSAPSGAAMPTRTPAAVATRDRLPAAIQQALVSNHVVVVSLYDPRAKIDDVALKEAAAGAQLAGVTFVPVDVTQSDVDPLNKHYGVIQDPAVLVLRPPGDLVVRIDGFADRDTVAQAAANAAQ